MAANRLSISLIYALLFVGSLSARAADSFEAKVTALWNQLPPLQTHYAGISGTEAANRLRQETKYHAFIREKLQGNWFAALTAEQPAYSLQARFETWKGLMDFLLERDALVEVWAYSEAGE